MTHSSSFLLPAVPAADNRPAITYALVVLNQPLPRFTHLLWNHGSFLFPFSFLCSKLRFFLSMAFWVACCVAQHGFAFAQTVERIGCMMNCHSCFLMKMPMMFVKGLTFAQYLWYFFVIYATFNTILDPWSLKSAIFLVMLTGLCHVCFISAKENAYYICVLLRGLLFRFVFGFIGSGIIERNMCVGAMLLACSSLLTPVESV